LIVFIDLNILQLCCHLAGSKVTGCYHLHHLILHIHLRTITCLLGEKG